MSDKQPDLDILFQAALEIESPEKRAAFLARSCGDNVVLRNEVENLLRSHQQAGSFLEQPAPELAATLLPDSVGQERAASLEAGLAAAFHGDAAVLMGGANHSVLKNLGKTIDLPRVVLREAAAQGREPVVRPKSPEMPDRGSDSRYQLHGEIARGGMGAILKGRDPDLGRDLAIKVLLDEHKDKPEAIHRFVEEAQIGGQLQHPGIAPVYELGQFPDRRPFFAMKLVKGETLAKLLADRADASAERGKLLAMFAKVCDTMAYAHSRGVIHRDLKPANIMVGAFGEVQVVDWGLAKVLTAGGLADEKKSRAVQQGQSIVQTLRSGSGSGPPGALGSLGSQTQMGSVMGTPAYMPPEQALGEIDNLDERADVFGLGAILCEILTGKPPYVGTDSTAVLRQASRGKLGDCLARLDACGADADLIVLTKQCLELEPKDRPRDASALAERVSGYLQAVETKLRQAELAKVDAQVRAEELRRRQKLAATAGAAIAASLVIGLAVSMWQAVRADREAARARSEEQRAVAALDELRATAPAFAEQARSLVAKEQFDEAIQKLDYAIKLRPDVADYLVAKGDLHQCQLDLAEAAAIYREALRVRPGLARAEASAKLCDELLTAKTKNDGKLTRESLAKLHLAMQREQRPAAEIMPVARLLGEEKKLLVDYWLARLKDLPVSAENPLEKRLTVREDGRMALDLSGTKVLDLAPLSGAPLATLNLSKCKDLTDISALRGMELIELNLSETGVVNLAPLREIQTLEKLSLAGSPVSDLAALSALRLKRLDLKSSAVRDLIPIRDMQLESIDLFNTKVADISPLMGMPLKQIDLSYAPVLDFSPLAELPLTVCRLQHSRIADLGVLRGKALTELCLWGCEHARNYAVLKEIQTLENVQLPDIYRDLPPEDYAAIGALRNHPKLRQLAASIMNGMSYEMTGSKDVFFQEWDREEAFFSELRAKGIVFTFRRLPSGAYVLDFFDQPLRDLSILKGMPIEELDLHRCPFVELTPLREHKLKKLSISSDSVVDFSPLRGMPLERLYLRNCSNLKDISPLTESPLRELYLDDNRNLSDVAPLAAILTLEKLTVPVHAHNVDALRKLPNLKQLGFGMLGGNPNSTADEFWKEYEKQGWLRALRASGVLKSVKQLSDGTWEVNLSNSSISDLTILSGAPISVLTLDHTPVSNLEALRGMAIKSLWLTGMNLTDLSPLKGMPLNVLHLSGVKMSDLSVLRGMPLTVLRLNGCTELMDISALRGAPLSNLTLHDCPRLTDLSPIADCQTLISLTLPANARDIEFLRALPKLERLGFREDKSNGYRPDKTAAEFWQEYDAKKK